MMGLFSVEVELSGPARSEVVTMLVDSGAVFCAVPQALADRLGRDGYTPFATPPLVPAIEHLGTRLPPVPAGGAAFSHHHGTGPTRFEWARRPVASLPTTSHPGPCSGRGKSGGPPGDCAGALHRGHNRAREEPHHRVEARGRDGGQRRRQVKSRAHDDDQQECPGYQRHRRIAKLRWAQT
jgi:hypothetical protein